MSMPPHSQASPQQWQSSQHVDDFEKRQTLESIQQISHPDAEHEEAGVSSVNWKPGFLSRFPWLGLGALVIVLCCSGGAIAVLAVSNGKSQTHWPQKIQPSVILSGLNNVANLCFSLAIANGVAIAWWRKALKGATIEDLHKSWSFSSSVKEAALAGKAFNVIALAALTAKFTIIDGMLMQSASTTYVAQDNPTGIDSITGWANQSFPQTGTYSMKDNTNTAVLYTAAQDLIVWESHPSQLPLTAFQGCEGTCFFNVPAAGFIYDCKTSSAAVTVTGSAGNWKINTQNGTKLRRRTQSTQLPLFNLDFSTYYAGHYTNGTRLPGTSAINMNLEYTKVNDISSGCSGTIYQNSCTLKPALVKYPVMMQNYSVGTRQIQGISVGITPESYASSKNPLTPFIPELGQQDGFELISYLPDVDISLEINEFMTAQTQQMSQLAGIQLAFSQNLGGKASLTDMGVEGFSLEKSGSANTWLLNDPLANNAMCTYQYDNPLLPSQDAQVHPQSIIASMNQITFAIAINAMTNLTATNTVPWQTFSGILYRDAVHYETRWPYAAGAIASTLFCILCILPVYWGYWQLGRKVSLGPFEIAHAFRSPMTARAANGGIEDVIKQVGKQEVQYGHIVSGDARGVVGIAEPEYVAGLTGGSAKSQFREKVNEMFGKGARTQ